MKIWPVVFYWKRKTNAYTLECFRYHQKYKPVESGRNY